MTVQTKKSDKSKDVIMKQPSTLMRASALKDFDENYKNID